MMPKKFTNKTRLVQKTDVAKIAKKTVIRMSEKKFHDHTFSLDPAAWNYSGIVVPFSNIAVGTSDSTRIGDRIRLRKLQLKMNLYVGTVNSTVRVIVFRWKLRYATDTPVPGSIIKSAFINTVYAPIGQLDYDNKASFQVLSDRVYSMGAGSDSVHRINQTIDLKDSPVQYHAGSTTDQNFGIYAMFINDNSAAAASATVYGVSRMLYTDM
ncbi:MAG: capsid protein [Cressdnaviricota sp.]|nr:MAG: capsid protein [Cressdnaviricota sp.]